MKIAHTIHLTIDEYGNCSDGTNMKDWSVGRLKNVLDTCWDGCIAEQAKRVLIKHKAEIDKIKL